MAEATMNYSKPEPGRQWLVRIKDGPLVGWFSEAHAARVADGLRRQGREVETSFMLTAKAADNSAAAKRVRDGGTPHTRVCPPLGPGG